MPKDENDKLSVFIRLILRHKPETMGISLEEHGWTDVRELLDGVNRAGRRIDFGMLEEKRAPELLYHGTAERFKDSVIKEGLKPMSRLYVHLSKDAGTAARVGKRHGSPSVLTVRPAMADKTGSPGIFYGICSRILTRASKELRKLIHIHCLDAVNVIHYNSYAGTSWYKSST